MMSISLYISSVLLPVNVSVMPLRTSIYMESLQIVGSKFLNSVLHRSLYREQYHHTASPQWRCVGLVLSRWASSCGALHTFSLLFGNIPYQRSVSHCDVISNCLVRCSADSSLTMAHQKDHTVEDRDRGRDSIPFVALSFVLLEVYHIVHDCNNSIASHWTE